MDIDKKKRVLFGFQAGLVEAIVMQPVDTVKVLRQSNQFPGLGTLLHQKGVRSLYKGLTPFTSQMGLKYLLRYSAFEHLRSPHNHVSSNLMAGIGAGVLESLFVSPFELIKTHLQTTRAKNPITVVKSLYQQNGWGGIYRGWTSTVVRQSINQGSNFTVYHELRKRIMKDRQTNEKIPTPLILAAGFCSGSVGPILNNPFDIIKTRYMNPAFRYTSLVEAIKDIIIHDGLQGLYRGLPLRLFRVAGGQALVF